MFRYLRVFIIFVLPYAIYCNPVVSSDDADANRESGGGGQWDVISKLVAGCGKFDTMIDCMGAKTIATLDRAARMNSIDLFPGVSFVADRQVLQERAARALMTDEEIENSISTRPNDDKRSKLIDMLFDSMAKFLESHSLQLRLPKSTSIEMQRAFAEGRSKLKKKLLPYLGVFAVKIFALLPVILGIVGFFAVKALFVGKIALIIAAILALQKYTGGGGFGGFGKMPQPPPDYYGASGSNFSPSVAANSAGGYYRRSVDDKGASHSLAYSAYSPNEVSA